MTPKTVLEFVDVPRSTSRNMSLQYLGESVGVSLLRIREHCIAVEKEFEGLYDDVRNKDWAARKCIKSTPSGRFALRHRQDSSYHLNANPRRQILWCSWCRQNRGSLMSHASLTMMIQVS